MRKRLKLKYDPLISFFCPVCKSKTRQARINNKRVCVGCNLSLTPNECLIIDRRDKNKHFKLGTDYILPSHYKL